MRQLPYRSFSTERLDTNMTSTLTAFIASIGLALVITAATLPGRQTPAVVDSLAWGGAHLEEASLGQKP